MSLPRFVTASALSLTLLISAVAANDTVSRPEAAWITFAKTPVQSNKEQEYHVRATKNAAPKLLKTISSFVDRSTDLRVSLDSYTDANLTFRTDTFLVTRIAGKEVKFAAGSQFPESVTRSLAKRFRAMGFDVEIVSPGVLLRRTKSSNLSLPEFVIPDSNTSAE